MSASAEVCELAIRRVSLGTSPLTYSGLSAEADIEGIPVERPQD